MSTTSIEWTDRTWNPVRGCSRVSSGCENCYAERMAGRFAKKGQPFYGFVRGPRQSLYPLTDLAQGTHTDGWTGRVDLLPHDTLDKPLHWRKPQRIFVNSISDLFHERLSDWQILDVFNVMVRCPQHTFQVLTKRPKRMLDWCERNVGARKPLSHIWLGVSAEDQATADERIPLLLQTPAAVRFVSYEPALGPVAFSSWLHDQDSACPTLYDDEGDQVLADYQECCCDEKDRRLNWLIIGGESGPRARPCDVEWIRSAMRQAKAAGVPVFVKQLGANVREPDPDGRPGIIQWSTEDRKGGDMAEWPEDLRVREFPK